MSRYENGEKLSTIRGTEPFGVRDIKKEEHHVEGLNREGSNIRNRER